MHEFNLRVETKMLWLGFAWTYYFLLKEINFSYHVISFLKGKRSRKIIFFLSFNNLTCFGSFKIIINSLSVFNN